jgi:DNA polymerase III gamma/tau subunit
MDEMDRKKLETAIESRVYKFVEMLTEQMYDGTMIYLGRNQIDIDRQVADRLLAIAKGAAMDAMYSHLDMFMKDMDKAITEFSGQENPLPRGKSSKK